MQNATAIADSGLGRSWDEFRQRLAGLRREGTAIVRGELDASRIGIAAPIFEGQSILGSLSFVLPAERMDDTLIGRIAPLTIAGAREIERAMDTAASMPAQPARVRVAR
jgi:DNA-binding IclR family transcriptional regulator